MAWWIYYGSYVTYLSRPGRASRNLTFVNRIVTPIWGSRGLHARTLRRAPRIGQCPLRNNENSSITKIATTMASRTNARA